MKGSYKFMMRCSTSFPNLFMAGDWIITRHGSWSQVIWDVQSILALPFLKFQLRPWTWKNVFDLFPLHRKKLMWLDGKQLILWLTILDMGNSLELSLLRKMSGTFKHLEASTEASMSSEPNCHFQISLCSEFVVGLLYSAHVYRRYVRHWTEQKQSKRRLEAMSWSGS